MIEACPRETLFYFYFDSFCFAVLGVCVYEAGAFSYGFDFAGFGNLCDFGVAALKDYFAV